MALFEIDDNVAQLLGGGLGFLGGQLASGQREDAVAQALQAAQPLNVAGPSGTTLFGPAGAAIGLPAAAQQGLGLARTGGVGALQDLTSTNFAGRETAELQRLQALRAPEISRARESLRSRLLNRGRLGLGIGGGTQGGLFQPEIAAQEEAIARTQLGDIQAARQMAQQDQRFLMNQAQGLFGLGSTITGPALAEAQLGIQARMPAAIAQQASLPGLADASSTQGFFSGLGSALFGGGTGGGGGLLGSLGSLFGGSPGDGGGLGNTQPGATMTTGGGGGVGLPPTPPGSSNLLGGFLDGGGEAANALLAGAFPEVLGSGFGIGGGLFGEALASGAGAITAGSAAPAFSLSGGLPAGALDFAFGPAAFEGVTGAGALAPTTGIAAGETAAAGGGLFSGLGSLSNLIGPAAGLAIGSVLIGGILGQVFGGDSPVQAGVKKFYEATSGGRPTTVNGRTITVVDPATPEGLAEYQKYGLNQQYGAGRTTAADAFLIEGSNGRELVQIDRNTGEPSIVSFENSQIGKAMAKEQQELAELAARHAVPAPVLSSLLPPPVAAPPPVLQPAADRIGGANIGNMTLQEMLAAQRRADMAR